MKKEIQSFCTPMVLLIENIKNLIGLEPEKLVGRFYKSLKAFKGTAAQIDDISFMTIKYKGTLKPDE